MISQLFVFSSLLLSTTGAGPHVGDQSNYSGTLESGSMSIPVQLSLKVTGYDASTGKFSVETTQVVSGRTQSSTAVRAGNEIGDDATANAVVSNCAAYGGQTEQVLMASAAPTPAINTCKISQSANGSTQLINIGAVPFMIVKYVNTDADGTVTKLNLTSYVRGAK